MTALTYLGGVVVTVWALSMVALFVAWVRASVEAATDEPAAKEWARETVDAWLDETIERLADEGAEILARERSER